MTASKISNSIDKVFQQNIKSEEAEYRTDTTIQLSRVAMQPILNTMTQSLQTYHAVLRLSGYNSQIQNESQVFRFTWIQTNINKS